MNVQYNNQKKYINIKAINEKCFLIRLLCLALYIHTYIYIYIYIVLFHFKCCNVGEFIYDR